METRTSFLSIFLLLFFSGNIFSQNFILPDSAEYAIAYLETGDSVKHHLDKNSEKSELIENVKNKMVDSIKYFFPNSISVFPVGLKMPEFPGGEIGLRKYISMNLKYMGSPGTVYVRFTVNIDGKPMNFKVVKSVVPYLDKEALRVIKTLPKFKPAIHNGKKVKVTYTIPVTFSTHY